MTITLCFHGDLLALLKGPCRDRGEVVYRLDRRASIKDIIESLGVPHPEVGDLVSHGQGIAFSHIPGVDERIEVHPLPVPMDVRQPTLLRPDPLATIRFLVDVNVGKLAVLLRMAGFDVAYEPHLLDATLADRAVAEGRILLTRDRTLLKRRQIDFGHLVRCSDPAGQIVEILRLYGLAVHLNPFSRCLCCNSMLQSVTKAAVLPRLLPLTRQYYDVFRWCPACDKVYWPGSHRDRMQRMLRPLYALKPTRDGGIS